MGGYGSGRQRYKQVAEDCRSLDVNRFHREGCLRPGKQGSWVWSSDSKEVGRIDYRAEVGQLVLDFRVRHGGSEWERIEETVRTTQAECTYGNTRPYFICPGVVDGRQCARRVGKLFAGGSYFLCRHCYRIAYASQSEAPCDRMLRRANKLRMALGGEPGTAYWIAPKPKGMWHRTYQRKVDEILRCESQADMAFYSKFAHFLGEEEREMYLGSSVF